MYTISQLVEPLLAPQDTLLQGVSQIIRYKHLKPKALPFSMWQDTGNNKEGQHIALHILLNINPL
jgi:hypothetical protein